MVDNSIGQSSCFEEIHVVENDTANSVDLKKIEIRPLRTFVAEVGSPSDIVFINNIKLYAFSSFDDDIAVVNLDSSYYFYGLSKFLRKKGYRPVDIADIDTLWHVKKMNQLWH